MGAAAEERGPGVGMALGGKPRLTSVSEIRRACLRNEATATRNAFLLASGYRITKKPADTPVGTGRLTLTVRWCLRDGWQRMLLVLQQPVQRFTSTQGGHIRKLADVGSTWLLGIS